MHTLCGATIGRFAPIECDRVVRFGAGNERLDEPLDDFVLPRESARRAEVLIEGPAGTALPR